MRSSLTRFVLSGEASHVAHEFTNIVHKDAHGKFDCRREIMSNIYEVKSQIETPETPDVPVPETPPVEPDPYPVTDPVPEPGPEPFPRPPEPIPEYPPDVF